MIAAVLPLDSPRWSTLRSSCSARPGAALARELLESIVAGDLEAFAELGHQTCHQGSVGEVAYAVVPHLVAVARAEPGSDRGGQALSLVGWIVASREIDAHADPCRSDLASSYASALPEALDLAASALRRSIADPGTCWSLIGTVAALQGQTDSPTT